MKKRVELNLNLYRKLYLIRRSEEKICENYNENDMKTPMHMSMGEEAIAVGVCHNLRNDDQIFTTYRSHASYLAKTENSYNFFAEMYGKENAILKGKGGSMHLCDPKKGFMGTSAIVSGVIPIAVGAAYANKVKKNNKIVTVFFGDGAIDEGVFWESINLASLMKIPVLFVCEDNGIAVHTHAVKRHGYKSISEIVKKYYCDVYRSSSTDVEEIYELLKRVTEKTRKTNKPSFLHLKYYRYLEHVGINEDFKDNYRPKKEYLKWLKKDPIKLQRNKLLKMGFTEEKIVECEKEIRDSIDESVLAAKNAAYADKNELYNGVFYEKN